MINNVLCWHFRCMPVRLASAIWESATSWKRSRCTTPETWDTRTLKICSAMPTNRSRWLSKGEFWLAVLTLRRRILKFNNARRTIYAPASLRGGGNSKFCFCSWRYIEVGNIFFVHFPIIVRCQHWKIRDFKFYRFATCSPPCHTHLGHLCFGR